MGGGRLCLDCDQLGRDQVPQGGLCGCSDAAVLDLLEEESTPAQQQALLM
jgi:hypothetical protein